MSRYCTIKYMIDPDEGMVYSRIGDEVAIPVLDWEGMKPENRYKTSYNLEKFHVRDLVGCYGHLIKTRKIPQAIKNMHRKFWGMKKLKGAK